MSHVVTITVCVILVRPKALHAYAHCGWAENPSTVTSVPKSIETRKVPAEDDLEIYMNTADPLSIGDRMISVILLERGRSKWKAPWNVKVRNWNSVEHFLLVTVELHEEGPLVHDDPS